MLFRSYLKANDETYEDGEIDLNSQEGEIKVGIVFWCISYIHVWIVVDLLPTKAVLVRFLDFSMIQLTS